MRVQKLLFVSAVVVALSGPVIASAQPRTMYRWRSFTESAFVSHSGNDGYYEIYVEKYGPLQDTEGWPVRAYVRFDLPFAGVSGGCWVPADGLVFDPQSGEVRVDAIVPSGDGCDWLDGANSVRLQVAWKPDGSYHSRRHYTLLGDVNKTSSEQGWEDRWLFAAVSGIVTADQLTSLPIPDEQSGSTRREWGHGVIPLFLGLPK